MNEKNISSAPRPSSAADALADLKKQCSYNRPSIQSSNNNNSDDDGCFTIFLWIIAFIIGFVLFSMM
jgi:hypothetical protein